MTPPIYTVEIRRDGRYRGRLRVRAVRISDAHQRVRDERIGHARYPNGDACDQVVVTNIQPEAS